MIRSVARVRIAVTDHIGCKARVSDCDDRRFHISGQRVGQLCARASRSQIGGSKVLSDVGTEFLCFFRKFGPSLFPVRRGD